MGRKIIMNISTKKEKIIDNFHGTLVEDPYRWLEDPNSKNTRQWVDEQNKRTEDYLNSFSSKKDIEKQLSTLTNYLKYTVPTKEGDYYYYHKNNGLQNQAVFYRTKDLVNIEEEVIIDPNLFSKEGTAAITNISFNEDGTKLAYGISYNGSDWQDVHIKDLLTGKDYPERLQWCKFSHIAWPKNGDGFYYNRYPEQDEFSFKDASYHNKVYWHKLGTSQATDTIIFEDPGQKELSFSPTICNDNKYLILHVNNGTEPRTNIYYRLLDDEGTFTQLFEDRTDYFSFIGNDDHTFYLYTNKNAPKGRVVAIDLHHPEKENWKDVIAEQNQVISFVKLINHRFVVSMMENAYDQLHIYTKEGQLENKIGLSKYITVLNVVGKEDDDLFISYTSFHSPPQVVKYHFTNQTQERVFSDSISEPNDNFETEQVIYTSKDGTNVPMFLTYKKGLKRTGDNPMLLYGYGGYNISMTPSFSSSQRLWIENGGIYAVANIRGGGEFGEEWHVAGILDKKQNSFDDFIAAAEWLIAEGYTNKNRIAIMGGSNGGLLVGACITQRPDLFGAAICLVPVTDMLRFQHFTVGRFWTTEFGNADTSREDFENMYRYSPLHNVRAGTLYPPTLITTADSDDRVAPLHAKKFAATLQEKQGDQSPTYLLVEKDAGHGLGKPTSKIIEHQTNIYTFLFKELGMKVSSS